jgi:3-hydroxybutyryl-CoA dehydrogenase
VEVKDVKTVAVIGAGTMGPGLAQAFACAGHVVWLHDISAPNLERALAVTASSLATFAKRGLVAAEDVPAVLARIRPTQSLEEAASAVQVVVESIIENLDAKGDLFEELDRLCPPGTIITSNTSYLDIFAVMPERRLPQTVIAHWFAPPQVVPLVEVVKGTETSQETVRLVVELLEAAGKAPVVMEKFVPGFCVNRFLRIIGREVFFLLDNGYMTADELDRAVKASIVPRAMVLGFAQRYDFTGLDLSLNNLQNPDYLEAPVDDSPRTLVEHVQKGELGVKTGRGIFDYGDRDITDVLSARDEALLEVFTATKDLIHKRI